MIDFHKLSNKELRDVIQAAKAVLKIRGSIPREVIPKLLKHMSETDLRILANRGRRFGKRPFDFLEYVSGLLENPKITVISSTDPTNVLKLLRIEFVSKGSSKVSVVLSDGTFRVFSKGRYSQQQVAIGEFADLSISDPWERLYSQFFVDACLNLGFPIHTFAFQIIKKYAAMTESPQETMLNCCIKTVKNTTCSETFGNWSSRERLSIGDVLLPSLSALDGNDHYWYDIPLLQTIVDACDMFLSTKNLLRNDLRTEPWMATPLHEIVQWYVQQYKRAETRAQMLLTEVSKELGFQHKNDHWIKQKGVNYVTIGDNLRVSVNGHFRCIVDGTSVPLPPGDQLVKRMLGLATTHRNTISTLAWDQPVLDEIFDDVDKVRLWDLVTTHGGTP